MTSADSKSLFNKFVAGLWDFLFQFQQMLYLWLNWPFIYFCMKKIFCFDIEHCYLMDFSIPVLSKYCTRPWDGLFLKLSSPQKLLYNSRLEFDREFKNIIDRFIHGEAGNYNQTILFLLKWLKNFFVNIPSWRYNRVTRVDRKC